MSVTYGGPVATSSPTELAPLFDDIFLEALDECDYIALFGLRHLEHRKGRSSVSEEHIPVALADLHATMGQQHFSAPVVDRSTCALAQEINQKLLLALDAIFSAMRPEATELRIVVEPPHQVVCHCGDRIIAAEPLVQRFALLAQCRYLLLPY